MDIQKRIAKAFEYLRFNHISETHAEVAKTMGANRANVSAAINGNPRYLTEPFLKRFARAYSDYINEEWLLTGEGQMEKPGKSMRPHFDSYASAGFMDGISEGKMSAEFRAMAIPHLNYDFSIDASGDSMLPSIENGDTLLCTVSDDRLNPPIDKICVIDTRDGALVKQIRRADDETLTLHSLNPRYPDRRIDISSINRIAVVVGLIRTFET